MLDPGPLFDELTSQGLGPWRETLEPLLREKLADGAHGDLPKWRRALATLPGHTPRAATLDTAVVTVGPAAFPPEERERVREVLLTLLPWRKGPFRVADILIDAEWRSEMKWARLAGAISPLAGRRVLDVGCGNGYYALRMRGAGARVVLGLDPMLLYAAQHTAIRHFMPPEPVHILPLRLGEVPIAAAFDTVFSMGVLYHQRDPVEHLEKLLGMLRQGGELVLETLILPGRRSEARKPQRYARMRNVWLLPTGTLLLDWLERAGFDEPRVVDVSATSTLEQRRTDWMPFESLADALDPDDPTLTIEGWPAPRRAIVVCGKPP